MFIIREISARATLDMRCSRCRRTGREVFDPDFAHLCRFLQLSNQMIVCEDCWEFIYTDYLLNTLMKSHNWSIEGF